MAEEAAGSGAIYAVRGGRLGDGRGGGGMSGDDEGSSLPLFDAITIKMSGVNATSSRECHARLSFAPSHSDGLGSMRLPPFLLLSPRWFACRTGAKHECHIQQLRTQHAEALRREADAPQQLTLEMGEIYAALEQQAAALEQTAGELEKAKQGADQRKRQHAEALQKVNGLESELQAYAEQLLASHEWRTEILITVISRPGLIESLFKSREIWRRQMQWVQATFVELARDHWGVKLGLCLTLTEHLPTRQTPRTAQL
eukprot:3100109-Pleurochrysis_carterae.AAC.3